MHLLCNTLPAAQGAPQLTLALNDSAAKHKILLVGIGSPFNDDTLGWDLLDALREEVAALPGCEWVLEKADRPGPSLLERMKDYDRAILLDALDAGLPPGTIRVLHKEDLATIKRPASSHAMGVGEVLALGESLQMLPSGLHLLGVQMGSRLNRQMVEQAIAMLNEIVTSSFVE